MLDKRGGRNTCESESYALTSTCGSGLVSAATFFTSALLLPLLLLYFSGLVSVATCFTALLLPLHLLYFSGLVSVATCFTSALLVPLLLLYFSGLVTTDERLMLSWITLNLRLMA